MELKIRIIYFYNIQKQILIPIHRHEYNLRCNAIDFFEIKKQHINNIYINYTLFSFPEKKIMKLHLEDFDSFRFLFINGVYIRDSKISIKSLVKAFYSKVFATKIDIYYIKYFSKKISIFSQDVVYLYIPSGIFVKKYIEILYVSTKKKSKMFNTKHLIFIDKGSCVKILERYKNLSKEKFFLSSITEIYQKAYSYIYFLKIKDDKPTYFLDHTSFLQEDRSESNVNSFSFYGESIINYLSIFQIGKEIHSYMNGLSMRQKYMTNSSLIEHTFPNGKSRDIYKGIFNKMANTTTNNKIIVLKSAKKTNASQNNKNILLINPININTNPKLEIFANDVKCFHGCTVGYLIPIEIFYLQSRGFSKKEAINKILLAFAKDILESISCKKIRNLINEKININVIISGNQ